MIMRIESASRWDALALTSRLARYRWYLIEPDADHWDVHIRVEQPKAEVPEDLRRTIESWLRDRRLERTVIHTGSDDHVITS